MPKATRSKAAVQKTFCDFIIQPSFKIDLVTNPCRATLVPAENKWGNSLSQ